MELKKPYNQLIVRLFVGVAGFEPATSASQTRRDDRATLHPELVLLRTFSLRRGGDSNPRSAFDGRRFSKPLLSASQAPLQYGEQIYTI